MLDDANRAAILLRAFEDAHSISFAFDLGNLRLTMVNDRACRSLRYDRADLMTRQVLALRPGLTGARLHRVLAPLITGHATRLSELTPLRRSDGGKIDVQIELQLIDGPSPQILAHALDVSRQRAAGTAACKARDRLTIAIEALPEAFVLYDHEDRLVICNERYRELYALSAPAIVPGATFESILRYGLDHGQYPTATGREADWLAERLALHKTSDATIEQQLDDGRWVRVNERATPDGGRVGFRVDITDIKAREVQLRAAALSDALTGLPNRRSVSAYLTGTASAIGPGQRLAVMHLDLDKFKAINDGMGHDAGDHLLSAISQRLRGHVRDTDLVARIGGDEFLILMRTDRSDADLHAVADRIRIDVARPVSYRSRICQVGVSIGIATWAPGSRHPIEQAIADADIALSAGKHGGRNRVVGFDIEMRAETVRKARLAQIIRDALDQNRIVAHFQPQLDITGRRVLGFEALARLQEPTGGLLGAGAFIPAAEEAGLMGNIDNTMLTRSLAFVRTLHDMGLRDVPVSVNISGAQLGDPSQPGKIARQVRAFGLTPDMLRLELLETTLLDERASQVAETIKALSGMGFPIELDDFGTGHTAIGSLRRFPVDRLKIDRSLIRDIDTDASIRVITETILGLARRLGIRALAEGVETAQELAVLRDLGCEEVQGYHFARPMAVPQALAWLLHRGFLSESPVPLFCDPDIAALMQAPSASRA